jgi:hypothetical protein
MGQGSVMNDPVQAAWAAFAKTIAQFITPHPEDVEWRKTHPTGKPWSPVNGPLSPDHQADHDV